MKIYILLISVSFLVAECSFAQTSKESATTCVTGKVKSKSRDGKKINKSRVKRATRKNFLCYSNWSATAANTKPKRKSMY